MVPDYDSYVDVFHKDFSYYDCRVCEAGDDYFVIKTFEGRVDIMINEVSWSYTE